MVRETDIDYIVNYADTMRGSSVDMDNNVIQIPFSPNTVEDDLYGEFGIATELQRRGFDVSFDKKDVEYTTKGSWINYRGSVRKSGQKAYLRNRLVMTVQW